MLGVSEVPRYLLNDHTRPTSQGIRVGLDENGITCFRIEAEVDNFLNLVHSRKNIILNAWSLGGK